MLLRAKDWRSQVQCSFLNEHQFSRRDCCSPSETPKPSTCSFLTSDKWISAQRFTWKHRQHLQYYITAINYWKDLVSHMVLIYGVVTYVDMERSSYKYLTCTINQTYRNSIKHMFYLVPLWEIRVAPSNRNWNQGLFVWSNVQAYNKRWSWPQKKW